MNIKKIEVVAGVIEDDRPGAGGMGDEDMDEPKKKKPRKIVEDDPSDLKDKLLKEENSVKLEIEWLIDSLGQYSYVSLPSTDSETAASHVWHSISIDEKYYDSYFRKFWSH